MSGFSADHEDVLRRELRAAADSVEPSGDGLERIRERIGMRPALSFASIAAWYSAMALRVAAVAEVAFVAVADVFWAVVDRFRPVAAGPGHARSRLGWLRPVAAMGTAIFVVAAGAFAILTLPHAMSSSSGFFSQLTQSGGSSPAGGGRSAAADGASPLSSSRAAAAGASGTAAASSAASKCSRVSGPLPGTGSPSPGSSNSTTPSPAGSTTPPTTTPPTTTPPVTTSPSPTPTTTSPGTASTATASVSSAAAVAGLGSATISAPPVPGTTGLTASRLKPASGRPSQSRTKSPCPSGSPTSQPQSSSLGERAEATLGGDGWVAAPPADAARKS